MNLDELQTLWNSTHNSPSSRERDALIAQFASSVRRRRRRELCWLAWTFSVLTLLTGFAGWILFGTNKVELTAEWAVIPLLLIPWTFAGLFLKRFLGLNTSRLDAGVTIASSLKAAFTANQSERFKVKAVGWMYLITVPVLAFGMWQLHSVGKITSRELISMATFLGGALALSAGAVLAKYRFGLVPEGQKLQALLSQFEPANQ